MKQINDQFHPPWLRVLMCMYLFLICVVPIEKLWWHFIGKKRWQKTLALLMILISCGCAGPGSAAKVLKALTPPKDAGKVKFVFTGWNARIEYERDNTPASTNGITLIQETTFRIK